IPIFWPALAFIFISGASLFVAESLSLGIGELIKLSNIIIIFILSWQTFVSKKEFSILIKVLLASIFVPACFAVYQLIFKMGLNFGGLSNRLYGTFGHPNAFAF